ncbi:hypothetical protein SUGI_0812130 [Cryptomeria japonica]|nr:hypothetical protein SUGI_0812130 [Cryptomeria japonica]
MASKGGEFRRGSGSDRLLTGEHIELASINGKGGQGKFISWSDETDEAFPIEATRIHTTGQRPIFKSTAWNDQTPGRPWKKKNFSSSNDGWFRSAKLPASDLARNWSSILNPNPSILETRIFNIPNGHKQYFNPPLGYGSNKFQNGWFRQDRASRADRAEAWCSTAPTRNQRSNLDRVGKNEPRRRYQSTVYPDIHKPNININVLPNDYYLIEFIKNEDMFKAKNKGPYTLDGIGVHIIDWKPNFNPQFHSLPKNIVWLRLYNCPSDYWHIEIIKDICKELGTFVSVEDWVCGSFIRICINTGQISSIPKEFKIIGFGKVWIQRIDKEDQLHLCPKCFSREHIGLDCEVSASVLKSYACVQTKLTDMKLYKENTDKWETNDVEQSSTVSMKVGEKNNPIVNSPLVVTSHQHILTDNSESAQALLNLLDDAKSLQKDIAIELATSLSSIPNKPVILVLWRIRLFPLCLLIQSPLVIWARKASPLTWKKEKLIPLPRNGKKILNRLPT